jgi:hypothetical protein
VLLASAVILIDAQELLANEDIDQKPVPEN